MLSGRDGSELRGYVQPRQRDDFLYGYDVQPLGDLDGDGELDIGFLDIFYDGWACGWPHVVQRDEARPLVDFDRRCVDALVPLGDINRDGFDDFALVYAGDRIEARSGVDGELVYTKRWPGDGDRKVRYELGFSTEQVRSIADVDDDGIRDLALTNAVSFDESTLLTVLSGVDGREVRRIGSANANTSRHSVRFEPLGRDAHAVVAWTVEEGYQGALHVLSTQSSDARLLIEAVDLAPECSIGVIDDYDGDGLGEVVVVRGWIATWCDVLSSRDGEVLATIEAAQNEGHLTRVFTGVLARLGDLDGDGRSELGAQMAVGTVDSDGYMDDGATYSLAVFSLRSDR